ncbi:UbiH/UbiF family hydroxylase [Rhodobacterales bacterium]|nr:UbiH/UbiF family hydroxylase [Rhodobacterales bacterium]
MPKNKTPDSFDVAVVGGGPAGRIAALTCAHAGYATVLLAPPAPKADGRTTALWEKSIELLQSLGVWDKLEDRSAPLRKMRMVDDTDRLIRAPEVIFDCSEIGLDCFGFNIINDDLNSALEERCAEIDTLTVVPSSLARAEFSDREARLETETGDRFSARLVIAADGRNSLVRDLAGIEVKRWQYPQVAVVLNLEHSLPHRDISTEFHSPTGPFTLVPLPGRRASLVCVETEQGASRLVSMTDEDLAVELERRAHSVLGKFKVISKPQKFPLSGMTAKRLVGERVALIAETAHVFPPIGAQGLNLSMRDISDLAAVLASAKVRQQDIGSQPVLQHYENKRKSDVRERTNAVDVLNRSLLTDFLPVQFARSTGMYLAGRFGPFRRFLMREGLAPKTGIRFPR